LAPAVRDPLPMSAVVDAGAERGEKLRIGISTCPNDVFVFHGLLAREVDAHGLELDFELADVEELNRRLLAGELDAAKASFSAALELAPSTLVLPVGAAIGRGVGPVVVAPREERSAQRAHEGEPVVLAPGEHTTATLLWRLLHPRAGPLRHVIFSEILPALARGEADFGVCIHEGRFTYADWGLRLVEDLGQRWELETGLPVPLGGVLARRALGSSRIARLAAAIRGSLDHARRHPERALATMRHHAQEARDEVLWKHVELYVTADTRELSVVARDALAELARRARPLGIGTPEALEIAGG
jgi:1,4-dihydroxy-6-naphthoate synthase